MDDIEFKKLLKNHIGDQDLDIDNVYRILTSRPNLIITQLNMLNVKFKVPHFILQDILYYLLRDILPVQKFKYIEDDFFKHIAQKSS